MEFLGGSYTPVTNVEKRRQKLCRILQTGDDQSTKQPLAARDPCTGRDHKRQFPFSLYGFFFPSSSSTHHMNRSELHYTHDEMTVMPSLFIQQRRVISLFFFSLSLFALRLLVLLLGISDEQVMQYFVVIKSMLRIAISVPNKTKGNWFILLAF